MTEAARAIRIIRRNLPLLRAKHRVRAIGIFGSYVRGEQHKRSDLDVLVEFTRTPFLLEYVALELYLSELTGKKVDLVMKRALKPHIGRHILSEAVYA
jgi:uncharacterized protein